MELFSQSIESEYPLWMELFLHLTDQGLVLGITLNFFKSNQSEMEIVDVVDISLVNQGLILGIS